MTGTNLQGTNIISMIVPTNHADTYATHDSFYGKGGWREVNTLDERNNIPEERRRIGMVCYVRETFKAYILKNSLTNGGWVPFNIDDEDYITRDELEEALTEALENYTTRTDVQAILTEGKYTTQQWVKDYVDGIDLAEYQKKTDNSLQTTNKTIVGAINELNSKPHIDTYSKAEEDALLALKSDKATTYTKTEVDTIIENLPIPDDVYSKAETDELLAGKANVGDSYTKAEIDEIIEDLPIAENVYTKEEVNTLLEAKANTSDVTNIENRVEAIEQGDVFVPTDEYEQKCAQYEADIAALKEENEALQTTISTMQTTLDYVYEIVTQPHYDVLPDEEP